MIKEIRIAGTPIDVPQGLNINLEEVSPLKDQSVTVGDFSQGFALPLTPLNRTLFGHPHRLDLREKTVLFENVEIVDDHFGNIRGTLLLQDTYEEDGHTWGDFDFFTNLLGIDIFETKLADLLTGSSVLGSTTAAIVATAKALNTAAMSANGSGGAVMKFVPHFNAEFYGDKNTDWYPETSAYKKTSSYNKGDYVQQVLAETDAARQNGANYTRVRIDNYAVPTGLNEIEFDVVAFGKYTTGLFATDRATFPAGKFKARVVAQIKFTGSTTQSIVLALRPSMSLSGVIVSESIFFDYAETRTVCIQVYLDTDLDDELFVAATPTNTDFELVKCELEIFEIEKHPAMPLIRFLALGEIPQQSNRENSAYWEIEPAGVINNWNAGFDYFEDNFLKERIDTSFLPVNRNCLVPWLQIHKVVHEIAKELGYTAQGEYMRDTLEQRALMFSNKALDKSSGRDTYAFVGSNYFETELGLNTIEFDRLSGVFTNENESYDTANHRYECITAGYHRIRLNVVWRNRTGSSGRPSIALRFGGASGEIYAQNNDQEFVDNKEIGETNIEIAEDLSVGDFVYAAMTQDGDYYEIISAEMEILNIETDDINIFDGAVNYADHVPDMTAAEFLEGLRVWKNLFLSFNGRDRTITLDYADPILKSKANIVDMDPYATVGPPQRVQLKPKKRFVMNYGALPADVFEPDSSYNVLDPVNGIDDLVVPTGLDDAILVKSLNAWFTAVVEDTAKIFQWQRKGSSYPDLLVEEQQIGDELYTIKPRLGPLPMGRAVLENNEIATMPFTVGEGRSVMFNSAGERPSELLITYWLGIDTSTVADGYPYATPTRTNGAGSNVFTRSMLWSEQYPAFWKRTLQSIVLEEIITRSFMIPAEVSQSLNWNRLVMLHHTPAVILKRIRAIGIAQRQQLEMRKVKLTEINVLDPVAEEVVEGQLYPITLSDYSMYFDGNTSDQRITINLFDLAATTGYTIMFEMALSNALPSENDSQCMMSKRGGGYIIMPITAGGNFRLRFGNTGNTYDPSDSDLRDLFNFYVTLKNGETDDIAYYNETDISLVGTTALNTDFAGQSGETRIFMDESSSARHLQGYLHRLIIFNKRLTAEEMNAFRLSSSYLEPTDAAQLGMKLYYKFDPTDGSVYKDGAGNWRVKNWARYYDGEETEALDDGKFIGAFRDKWDGVLDNFTDNMLDVGHADTHYTPTASIL
jgi:hypothetical protein